MTYIARRRREGLSPSERREQRRHEALVAKLNDKLWLRNQVPDEHHGRERKK